MEDVATTESATTAVRNTRRIRWWGWLLLTVFALNALLAVGCLGGVYLLAYLPEQYAEQPASPYWAQNNVNQLAFQDDKAFLSAQNRLRNLAFQKSGATDPVPRLLLGDLFEMTGKQKAATYFYRETLGITEANWYNCIVMTALSSHAHEKLALLYYEQGDEQASLREIRALGDLTETAENPYLLHVLQDRLEYPDRADFRLELARELRNIYKLKLAHREAKEAIRLSRTPSLRYEATGFLQAEIPVHHREFTPMTRYYLMAGNVQASADNMKAAVSFYKKAIQENPNFEWSYNSLAIIYRHLQKYPEARKAASMAIALNPDFYHPYLTLGDISLDRENFAEAIHHFQAGQSILKRLPENEAPGQRINLENQLAFAFESTQDYPAAISHYTRALYLAQADETAYDDDYNYAREGLGRVRKALGRK